MDTEWAIPSAGKVNTQSSAHTQVLSYFPVALLRHSGQLPLMGRDAMGKKSQRQEQEGPGHLAAVVEGGETDAC